MPKKAHTSNKSWLEFNAADESPKLPPLQRFDRIFAPAGGNTFYGLYWFNFKTEVDESTNISESAEYRCFNAMPPLQAYANKPQQPITELKAGLPRRSAWKYTKGMLEWFLATWARLSGNGLREVTLRDIHDDLVTAIRLTNLITKFVSKIPETSGCLQAHTWPVYHYTNMLLYVVDTLSGAGIVANETSPVHKVFDNYVYLKESIRSVTALDDLIYEALDYRRDADIGGISSIVELSQTRRIEKLHYAAIEI